MPYRGSDWLVLAGGFPPTLVTYADPADLKLNESPACRGVSASDEGYLVAGTLPTGTARVAKSYASVTTPGTNSSATYTYYYDRLWRASNASLIYGAPGYTAAYYAQGRGQLDFNDDTGSIVTFLPIGQGGLVVFKSTGAYILPDASSLTGRFGWTQFVQEALITTATHAVELDGDVYFSNTGGLFRLRPGGEVEELSAPLRGTLTTAYALTCDYKKKWIILGASTGYVYDVQSKRWLDYSSSGTLFTTRTLRDKDGRPFCVSDVALEYELSTGTTYELEVYVSTGASWEPLAQAVVLDNTGEGERLSMFPVEQPVSAREFRLKITSLPAGVKLRRILVKSEDYTFESGGD